MNDTRLDRRDVLSYLDGCNELELFELFYEAVEKYRDTYSEGDSREYVDTAYAISRGKLREEGSANLIAKPDRSSDAYVSSVLTQNGYCQTCRLEEIGFSRSSICPICSELVDMT